MSAAQPEPRLATRVLRAPAIWSLLALIAAWAIALGAYLSSNLVALGACVALLAIAFRTSPPPAGRPQVRAAAPAKNGGLVAGTIAVLASLTAAIVAERDPLNPAANYLWLASLALILLAALQHDRLVRDAWRAHFDALRKRCPLAPRIALASRQGGQLRARTGGFGRCQGAQLRVGAYQPRRRESLLVFAALGLATLTAFILRAYDLRSFPPVLHGDEGEMGVIALDILAGKPLPMFAASPFFSLPYLFNYLQAISLTIFGHDEVGLRMLSAVVGAACVPVLYAIGSSGWGRLAGLAAAWLMVVSHLDIHFSRLGFIFIESVLAMLVMIWLLARAHAQPVNNDSLTVFAAAGLTIGLAQYFYYASRVMPVIAAVLLAFLWLEHRASLKQIAAAVVAGIVAFAPLGLYFAGHMDVFLDRVGFVSILSAENVQHTLGPGAAWPRDWLPLLQFQLSHNLQMFVRGGDAGGFYFQNLPAFDPLTSVLFWLGLGMAVAQAWRYHEFALLVWFGLGLVFGGLLTIDAPSAQRLMILVPCVYLCGGVFVGRSCRFVASLAPRLRSWPAAAGIAVIALLVLVVNVQAYFVDYASETQGREPVMIAHELVTQPQPTRFYLLGEPVLYSNHGAIRFIARGVKVQDLFGAQDFAPPAPGEAVMVFAVPNHLNDLHLLQSRFAGGTTTTHVDPLGRLIYVTYRLAPQVGH